MLSPAVTIANMFKINNNRVAEEREMKRMVIIFQFRNDNVDILSFIFSYYHKLICSLAFAMPLFRNLAVMNRSQIWKQRHGRMRESKFRQKHHRNTIVKIELYLEIFMSPFSKDSFKSVCIKIGDIYPSKASMFEKIIRII